MATELNLEMLSQDTTSKSEETTALGSIEENLVSLRIFLAKSNTGITDYKSLQHYGTLRWEVQRLLWIGYKKNITNPSCSFAQLPKDVIKCIIKFFLFDENDVSSHVCGFSKDTTFKDIADRYDTELDDKVKKYLETDKWAQKKYSPKDWTDQYPHVRLWCQFGCIKQLYPVKARSVTVTEADINIDTNVNEDDSKEDGIRNKKINNYNDDDNNGNNDKRWVEIPDDWLKYEITSPLINIVDFNRICVEFLCLDSKSVVANDSDTSKDNYKNKNKDNIYNLNQGQNILKLELSDDPTGLNDTPLYWPLAKGNTEWNNVEIGDMVDVIVKTNLYTCVQ